MENVAIDPLAGLSPELPEGTARDHAAALVLGNGTTLEAANAALAARGMAGLTANSREAAEAARAALLNDDGFRARYGQGDPSAIAALFQADLKVQQSAGKLTDRPTAPSDYKLNVAQHLPPDMPPESVQGYGDELAKLAAAIQLPKESAAALVDSHFAAERETAVMSADERGMFAQEQTAMLHNALGANAGEQIKAATETFAKAGRPLDIAKIVQSNGAEAALILVHQAQVLAARGG
jgi:hypothetical protein